MATEPIFVESMWDSSGYDTPEAAIGAAKRHPLQARARQDAASFAGRQFADAWSDVEQWVLEFSGPLWLRVFPRAHEVHWTVEHTRPQVTAVPGPIGLQWVSGARSCSDPALLAAGRRGAEFWQFWLNDMGFHVYLRGKLILCFSVVKRLDTGRQILWVWEDD
jgi:hypothetical protein